MLLNKWDKVSNGYVATCECGRNIKSKAYYLSKHSGKCRSCIHKKLPFFHVFTRLKGTANTEKHSIELTFEDFLKFTEIKTCHYCKTEIPWQPYRYSKNNYTKGGGYFLDRLNNNLGYSVENCVVCCTRCNIAKGNRFNYKEWYGMTKYFRDNK